MKALLKGLSGEGKKEEKRKKKEEEDQESQESSKKSCLLRIRKDMYRMLQTLKDCV